MAKRFKAEKAVIFAVYKKCWLMNSPMRYFKIAFPSLDEALAWAEKDAAERSEKKENYMVEEMHATMKAWVENEARFIQHIQDLRL